MNSSFDSPNRISGSRGNISEAMAEKSAPETALMHAHRTAAAANELATRVHNLASTLLGAGFIGPDTGGDALCAGVIPELRTRFDTALDRMRTAHDALEAMERELSR